MDDRHGLQRRTPCARAASTSAASSPGLDERGIDAPAPDHAADARALPAVPVSTGARPMASRLALGMQLQYLAA